MALTGDDFSDFLNEKSGAIQNNLNLTDDLLSTMGSKRYFPKLKHEELRNTFAYKRTLEFPSILIAQPDDYMTLKKTQDLIDVLGNRQHPRPTVQKIFEEWKNKLLNINTETASAPEASQPVAGMNPQLQQASGSNSEPPVSQVDVETLKSFQSSGNRGTKAVPKKEQSEPNCPEQRFQPGAHFANLGDPDFTDSRQVLACAKMSEEDFRKFWQTLSPNLNLEDLVLQDLSRIGVLDVDKLILVQNLEDRVTGFRDVLFDNLKHSMEIVPPMIQVFKKHKNSPVVSKLEQLLPHGTRKSGSDIKNSKPSSKQNPSGVLDHLETVYLQPSGSSSVVFNVKHIGSVVMSQTNISKSTINTNTYIGSAIMNGNLDWTVDGNKVESLEDIKKLIDRFEVEKLSPTGKAFRKGQVMYLNWRYDTERTPTFFQKWKLRFGIRSDDGYDQNKLVSALKDEPKVKELFASLTNCKESDIFLRKNLSKQGLEKAIDSFKKKVEAAPDTDYIVVILSAHGCNRTQLITDDLEQVDIFDEIVWKLDYEQWGIKGLAQDKPRLYLVNACQGKNKGYAFKAAKEMKAEDFQRCSSPYFIFCSTLPDELSYGDKKHGTVFYNAICNGGFTKDVSMYNMVAMVQKKVAGKAEELAWMHKNSLTERKKYEEAEKVRQMTQTTSIMQSSTFETNLFAFTD